VPNTSEAEYVFKITERGIENLEVVTSRSFDVLIYDPENNIVYQRRSASTKILFPERLKNIGLKFTTSPT